MQDGLRAGGEGEVGPLQFGGMGARHAEQEDERGGLLRTFAIDRGGLRELARAYTPPDDTSK